MKHKLDIWQILLSAAIVLMLMVVAVLGLPGMVNATQTVSHSQPQANLANYGSTSENGSAGFFGIGTNTPTRILTVTGTGPGTVPWFQRGTDSAGFIIERTPENRWVLGVNESPSLGNGFVISTYPVGAGSSTPRLMVDLNGRVGIGTTSPTKKLEVQTDSGEAVYGLNTDSGGNNGYLGGANYGVYGYSNGGNGVRGGSDSGIGVYGYSSSGYAGYFSGTVYVSGFLTKAGGGFKIDHPQDPENMYLIHSFVESPDMMNVYRGHILLDDKGEARVQMPAYFETLNRDFEYQLTAVGAPAPSLYVAEEILGNSFKIAGGKAGLKVSWQVTGIRKDAFANAHPIVVEQEKPANEQGLYLHPKEWGQPESKGIATLNKP